MIQVEEMKNAVGKNCIIKYLNNHIRKCVVESYQYEEGEDEEPFILYEPNFAAYQSELESIEILD